jgi:triacylglycerol lipase
MQKPEEHRQLAQLGLGKPVTFSGLRDTQGFIAADEEHIVIAFRGTEDIRTRAGIRDWITNVRYTQSRFRNTLVHRGFLEAWRSVEGVAMSHLRKMRQHGQQVWLTGHSLGGAIATIAAKDLAAGMRVRPAGIHTFGAPRVGNPDFAGRFGLNLHRFVHEDDIVPHIPFRGIVNRYQHAGRGHYLLPDGSVSSNDAVWNRLLRNVARIMVFGVQSIPQKALDDHSLEQGYIRKLESHYFVRKWR